MRARADAVRSWVAGLHAGQLAMLLLAAAAAALFAGRQAADMGADVPAARQGALVYGDSAQQARRGVEDLLWVQRTGTVRLGGLSVSHVRELPAALTAQRERVADYQAAAMLLDDEAARLTWRRWAWAAVAGLGAVGAWLALWTWLGARVRRAGAPA